jgi:hypothetical protein
VPSQVERAPGLVSASTRVAHEALRLLRWVLVQRAAAGRGSLVSARYGPALILAGCCLASGAASGGRVPRGSSPTVMYYSIGSKGGSV